MSSPRNSTTPLQDSDHSRYYQYPRHGTSIDRSFPGGSLSTNAFPDGSLPGNTQVNAITMNEPNDGSTYVSQPTAPIEEHESESEESKRRCRQQKRAGSLRSQMINEGAAAHAQEVLLTDPSRSSILHKRFQRSHRIGSTLPKSGVTTHYRPASRQPTNGHTGKTTRIRHAGEKLKSGDQRSVRDGDSVMSVEGQGSPSGTGADDEVMENKLPKDFEYLSVNEG